MAREKTVAELACNRPVVEAARRVLRSRLQELRLRHELAANPEDSVALHDLRIAAKRLRYSLETFGFCFRAGALEAAADEMRVLQEVLGRVHDLDEALSRLNAQVLARDAARHERAMCVLGSEGAEAERLAGLREVMNEARGREEVFGLFTIMGRKMDERRRRHADYMKLWDDWDQRRVLDKLASLLETDDEGLEGHAG